MPYKKKIQKQWIFDEQKQKPKNRLQFEKEVKPQSDIYHSSPIQNSADTLQYEATNKIYTKVAEVEHDNTAVEATHKTKQKAETLSRYSMRTARYIDGQRKAAPYKKRLQGGNTEQTKRKSRQFTKKRLSKSRS